MAERIIKLPDVGEGVAEAEIVEVHVAVGDLVREDQILAAVMTDKATVEIPSPVDGRVVRVAISAGQTVAVHAEMFAVEVDGAGKTVTAATVGRSEPATPQAQTRRAKSDVAGGSRVHAGPDVRAQDVGLPPPVADSLRPTVTTPANRPLASPAVRQKARDLGLDLKRVAGSGPAGRIRHEDLERAAAPPAASQRSTAALADTGVTEIKLSGLRRAISKRMADTNRRIPHFAIIEEVDVTDLETLRADLNSSGKAGASGKADRPKLTILPFVMRALVVALREHPEMNARFDDETETIQRYGGVHIGIATHTPGGLMVPVVRHAEARSIWECAREVARLSQAARAGSIGRDDLQGSTITITSLGPLGGLATTPIINAPEVAIVGINKISMRAVWGGNSFEPRRMMNISSSFDHRIIDGFVAAEFVQKIRKLLETPAKIFLEA
jgi:2-oxoisovalerate dehydrogenase E2 component (dihydrolipoyl transacylase)